jgi:hypothetical protein
MVVNIHRLMLPTGPDHGISSRYPVEKEIESSRHIQHMDSQYP